MLNGQKGSSRTLTLTVSFAALYAILCLLPISPIIGLPGTAITAAAILAPLLGIMLGAYTGALSALVGGSITFLAGFYSAPSLVSGAVASLCAGLLSRGKQTASAATCLLLLIIFCFFPAIGPAWLYPPQVWFNVVGLLIIASPIQTSASKKLSSALHTELFYAIFVTSLTSTLAGRIAGSIVFEASILPAFIGDPAAWQTTWQISAFLYPVERVIIAVAAALIGTPLVKALKPADLKLPQR